MAPIESQPRGQTEGAEMAPAKGDLAAINSAKWLGTFAKSAGPIWSMILTAAIGAFWLLHSAGVWFGENIAKPGFDDWRATWKDTSQTNRDLVMLLKDAQKDRERSSFEAHRRDSYMETQTATMQSVAKHLERMEQTLNSLVEGK